MSDIKQRVLIVIESVIIIVHGEMLSEGGVLSLIHI